MKFYLGNGITITASQSKYLYFTKISPSEAFTYIHLKKIFEYLSDWGGYGSKEKRGRAAVIDHCFKEYGIKVSQTELKKITSSLLKNKEHTICFPYELVAIIQSIKDLAKNRQAANDLCDKLFNSLSKKQLPTNCMMVLTPNHYFIYQSNLKSKSIQPNRSTEEMKLSKLIENIKKMPSNCS